MASKKRDNEIYLEKQKAEQTKFAKVNDNVHNLFAKLMGRIEEIDIAGTICILASANRAFVLSSERKI